MAPALGSLYACETVRNARIQACSWVSMALALGSLWVLNASEIAKAARVQICSWVSMPPILGLYGSCVLLLCGLDTHIHVYIHTYIHSCTHTNIQTYSKGRSILYGNRSVMLLGLYGF